MQSEKIVSYVSCGPLEIGLEVSVGAEVTGNSGSNSDLFIYLFILWSHHSHTFGDTINNYLSPERFTTPLMIVLYVRESITAVLMKSNISKFNM